MKQMNVLDLFCGCGGMTNGFDRNPFFKMVAGIDIWDKAIETYRNNYNHLALCKNLSTYHPEEFRVDHLIEEIDIIVGGFPCQSFSMAGKRALGDIRDNLFLVFVEYLDYFKPKVFIAENVVGILSKKNADGDKIIDDIMLIFNKNYHCQYFKVLASEFNVPQNRRRVIFIGYRKDYNLFPSHPRPVTTPIPVKNVLLKRDDVPCKYFLSQRAIDGIAKKKQRMKEKKYGFGAQYINPDKPCFTIPARYWKDGYDALVKYDEDNIRRLTEYELKLIQSFPETFTFNGTKKDIIMQIGNAVPCNLAYYLSCHIKNDFFDKFEK